jgi:competence protein ComFC
LFEGVLRRSILALKYGHREDLAAALSVPMVRVFKERAELHKNQCVVPVPLHFIKRHGRGFNQAELLGRGLADGVGLPLVSGVLVRRRWTWAQARLGREQRKANVAGAFTVRYPDAVRGKRILLVDDVCTTGSTLESCAEALKQAGARSVDALTLARDYTGPSPDSRKSAFLPSP